MNSAQSYKNYRDLLRDELSERTQRNPRYSLRAFARDLGFSASTLSEVLSGHHSLSPRLLKRLANQLGLSPKQEKQLSKKRTKNVSKENDIFLAEEAFQLISNWYHFAILELFNTENFKLDTEKVARLLDISEWTVKSAIERLQTLNYLKKEKDEWRLNSPHEHVVTPKPSAAIREFHKQAIQKALESLRPDNLDEREFQTLFLAFPKNRIREAKGMINSFRQEFAKKFRQKNKKNSLYSLSMQFYEITKREKI
ncbi:MAG: hypothetical protein A4S09_10395 [Proteobacteria bacterium SG_bin7]|nr:MAG: hypothetical protein A4S09_10395 [Proteobacteria bacterium SG_bin7]